MPEISVIIPCYNQGQYVDEAVESVLAQTFQDIEIIVVDDGSTDKLTAERLSSFAKPKTRIIHIQNQGVASARNRGIREANGKYILPLDADDMIGEDYLSRAYEVLEMENNVGIVYCEAELFGDRKGKWSLPDYDLKRMLLDNLIFASAFFKKEDWQKVGGYNTNMKAGWEDWDFWLSLIELGREVYRIPEVLFHYRIKKHSRTKSLSKSNYIELHSQLFRNHKKLYIDNVESIFNEMYDIKHSWSYKASRAIKNPVRIYDKFFRI